MARLADILFVGSHGRGHCGETSPDTTRLAAGDRIDILRTVHGGYGAAVQMGVSGAVRHRYFNNPHVQNVHLQSYHVRSTKYLLGVWLYYVRIKHRLSSARTASSSR